MMIGETFSDIGYEEMARIRGEEYAVVVLTNCSTHYLVARHDYESPGHQVVLLMSYRYSDDFRQKFLDALSFAVTEVKMQILRSV